MMAGWFGNFDYISDDLLNLLDLPLEDVEEDQGDGQLEPPPWDVIHITDCLNAQVDAPEFKNCGIILHGGLRRCSTNRANLQFSVQAAPAAVAAATYAVETKHEDSSLTKPLLKDALPITVKSGDASDGKNLQVLQTTSPVSVLESSSTPSAGKSAALDPKVTFVKRPRTKHPRTKRRHPESLKLTVDMSYKSAAKKYCNHSDMIEEPKDLSWGHLHKTCFQTRQEEKNISPIFNASFEMRNIVFQKPFATRKCTHCEATKTPLWREGPQGPKTLCNACGVRYRTGRLFPEYRPAGSPTYVHSLHSNSHKKVLELRHKAKLCETPLSRRNFNG